MMSTVFGNVNSDQLENGIVISGVEINLTHRAQANTLADLIQ